MEGERALLRALIVHKLGVIPRSVEAARETADEPSLPVWAERIFSARSAEEVVAERTLVAETQSGQRSLGSSTCLTRLRQPPEGPQARCCDSVRVQPSWRS